MGKSGAAIALVAIATAVLGCKKTKVEASTRNEGEVVFETSDLSALSVTVNGKKYDGGHALHVAALELPLGEQKLEAEVKGKKVPFTMNRPAVAPRVSFARPPDTEGDKDSAFGVKGTTILVAVDGPPLETVDVAGQSVKTSPLSVDGVRGTAPIVTIDLRARVLDSSAAFVAAIDLPVKTTADSSKDSTLRVPVDVVKTMMWTIAREIDKGPLAGGSDDAMPKSGPRSLFIAGDELVGAPAKLREIDLIALPLVEERPTGKSCGGYGTAGAAGAPLFLLDRRVKVYERRTGKLIKEKLFSAPDKCPSMISAVETKGPGGVAIQHGTRAESNADFRDVRAWLKTLLKP